MSPKHPSRVSWQGFGGCQKFRKCRFMSATVHCASRLSLSSLSGPHNGCYELGQLHHRHIANGHLAWRHSCWHSCCLACWHSCCFCSHYHCRLRLYRWCFRRRRHCALIEPRLLAFSSIALLKAISGSRRPVI